MSGVSTLTLSSSYLHSLTTGDQKVRQSCDSWGTPLHSAGPPVMCPLPPGSQHEAKFLVSDILLR